MDGSCRPPDQFPTTPPPNTLDELLDKRSIPSERRQAVVARTKELLAATEYLSNATPSLTTLQETVSLVCHDEEKREDLGGLARRYGSFVDDPEPFRIQWFNGQMKELEAKRGQMTPEEWTVNQARSLLSRYLTEDEIRRSVYSSRLRAIVHDLVQDPSLTVLPAEKRGLFFWKEIAALTVKCYQREMVFPAQMARRILEREFTARFSEDAPMVQLHNAIVNGCLFKRGERRILSPGFPAEDAEIQSVSDQIEAAGLSGRLVVENRRLLVEDHPVADRGTATDFDHLILLRAFLGKSLQDFDSLKSVASTGFLSSIRQ